MPPRTLDTSTCARSDGGFESGIASGGLERDRVVGSGFADADVLLRGENEAELVVEVSADALLLEHRLGREERRAKARNKECVGQFENGRRC